MKFKDYLDYELNTKKSMELQDVIKMCYQAAFGAEHLLEDLERALAYFDEALELAPDFSPALLGKAETLRMTRRYDEYFGVLGSYVENPSESSMAKAPECFATSCRSLSARCRAWQAQRTSTYSSEEAE